MPTPVSRRCPSGAASAACRVSTATTRRRRAGRCASVSSSPTARPGRARPVLYFLAGLTCTEETFAIKAGAQRAAAALGLVLVTCDTSPRAARYPGDDADEDFGLGAGFYVDATEEPWRASYRMDTYVTARAPRRRRGELPGPARRARASSATRWAATAPWRWRCAIRTATAASRPSRRSSRPRGFPGAARRSPATWAPTRRPGPRTTLARWCAARPLPIPLLVDQGTADKFLDVQLKPELFEAACAEAGQSLRLRRHAGYDHSYYFIASFVDEHLAHHARALAP